MTSAPQARYFPARLLLPVYAFLTAYASLYPLAGWREPGASAFSFLAAGWPRALYAFDFWVNVLGYVPLGLLCAAAAFPALRGARAVLAAGVAGALLSLGLEAAQSFLPTRYPSNVDLVANFAGACLGGAIGARLAPALIQGARLGRLHDALLRPGIAADVGLTLIGLWLFLQLDPTTLLFGTGDLRGLLGSVEEGPYAAQFFVAIECTVTAANLVAFGLLVSALLKPGVGAPAVIAALVVGALLVKTLAFAILMRAEQVLRWLTPGAQAGLVAGAALLLALALLPRLARLALAALLLMAAAVLVNIAPPNPYLAVTLKVWEQGHFLHFVGLTRLVSAAWPFAALAYLFYLASRHAKDDPG